MTPELHARRPATAAEAFANTARALERFSVERVRVEGLSGPTGRREKNNDDDDDDDDGVRTLTEQAFMREFVFESRPCVIVGALEGWPAVRRWRDDAYLFDLDGHVASEAETVPSGEGEREKETSRRVTVALTPNGRADAVTYVTYCNDEEGEERSGGENGDANGEEDMKGEVVTKKLFMSAAEVRATLPELYRLLRANPPHPPPKPLFVDMRHPAPVIAYAQMQNNCLEMEYQHLHVDICSELDRFGERVFGGPHEAANVWFGTPASVSSMHQDWVENLYAVVRGVKEFLLIPPWEGVFVPKPELPSAAFSVKQNGADGSYVFDKAPVRDESSVPWMDVDFTPAVVEDASLLPENLRDRLHPLVVYVQPGEVLYLPAMWLHRVAQHADETDRRAIEQRTESSTCPGETQDSPLPLIAAVNYWYDMSFTNPAVVMLREFGLLL